MDFSSPISPHSESAELAAAAVFGGGTIGYERDEVVRACKTDLNFLAAFCLPEVYRFPFPPIYLAQWELITDSLLKEEIFWISEDSEEEESQDKFVIGLPRGFAKTLLLKLATVFCVLFTTRKFVLITCNTATLAENFLADVMDTLGSENVRRVFGDWSLGVEKDTQPLKKFTFRGRDIILAGLGSGSSLRGLNLKYVRPDVMFMDDMQSKEESDSAVDSNNQLIWMLGTLLKANNKSRCTFVYLGNMYVSEGCILKKLKTNPAWISFITGAILEDGESLWPQLRSVNSLLKELENDESMGHPEIFYSEVLNDDEAGSRNTVDFSKINIWTPPADEIMIHEGGWILIDPALAKQASDDCAIGGFHLYNGEPIMVKVESGKFDEKEKIRVALTMAIQLKVMVVIVEAVAYQESLCFWLDHFKNQLGLQSLRILTISPAGIAKNSRILAMLKQLTAQQERIWIAVTLRSLVVHQIIYWNPLKKKNKDDILDLLAYAYKIIIEYGVLLLSPWELIDGEVKASFSEEDGVSEPLVLEF